MAPPLRTLAWRHPVLGSVVLVTYLAVLVGALYLVAGVTTWCPWLLGTHDPAANAPRIQWS